MSNILCIQQSRIMNVVVASLACMIIAVLWWCLPHPVVVIAVALLAPAVWLAVKYPFHIVLGFVIFSFFRLHESIPVLYSLKIPLLLAIAALFVIFWHVVISRQVSIYWSRELSVLSLFFVFVTLGMLMATNRGVAMAEWSGVYVKIYIMTIACAWMLNKEKDFVLMTRLFWIAGVVTAIVALYNKSMGIGLVEGTRVTIARDLESILGDPNDLALVLLFPAAFSMAMLCEKRAHIIERVLGGVGFVVLLMAVIATQSRGGLLGITAVLGIFAFFKVKSKLLLVIGGVVVMFILYAVAGISDRSSGGAAEEGIDESAMGRLYAWGAAWGMALDNPVFGVGLKNFYSNYYFYSAHWDGLNHAVHSTWFGVLGETGFVGLILFITMVILVLRTAFSNANKAVAVNLPPSISITAMAMPAGVTGFVISGTFLTQGFTWPIYLQLAIVVACWHWLRRQRKS